MSTTANLVSVDTIRLPRWDWLAIPDLLRILLNTPVTAEEAHSCHGGDALFDPSILIFISFINKRMSLDIAVEIIRDKVIVAMVDDAVAESGETGCVAESPRFDGVKDLCEIWIEMERAIVVSMAKVFDIFC